MTFSVLEVGYLLVDKLQNSVRSPLTVVPELLDKKYMQSKVETVYHPNKSFGVESSASMLIDSAMLFKFRSFVR